jgi:2-iminobutanoate/2-iminopropanoate deaminase
MQHKHKHPTQRASSTGDPPPPFSPAILAGETLYVAGTIGFATTPPSDPAVEANGVLEAVQSVLESFGFTMNNLAMVTIFTSDLAYYDVFNTVYATYFGTQFPARAFIGAGSLVKGARFEVTAVADGRVQLQ